MGGNMQDAIILDTHDGSQLAEVMLNGYNIEQGGPLGLAGRMRSFMLVSGSLRYAWRRQQVMRLETPDGQTIDVRVAALPATADSMGLIEFLG